MHVAMKMDGNDILEIIKILTDEGIDVWLDGGWGIDGHAYTNAEIAETARRILSGE